MNKFVYNVEDKITANGQTLYRILANKDIKTQYITILKGEKGGYIAKGVLSGDGNAWVDENSKVLSGSYVSGDAYISNSIIENSTIEGETVVLDSKIKSVGNSHSTISGNSKVVNSTVVGAVEMNDNARLDTCKLNGYLKMHNSGTLINCNIKTDHLEIFGTEMVIGKTITGAGNLQTANIENPKTDLEF